MRSDKKKTEAIQKKTMALENKEKLKKSSLKPLPFILTSNDKIRDTHTS